MSKKSPGDLIDQSIDQPNDRSSDRSIDKMTAYCMYCPKMCRFSCPVAEAEHRETVTPWGLMRLLKMVNDGTVEPSPEIAETFYHCTGCRRCQNWCRHDNDVPKAMWEARAQMVQLGHIPPAFQDLAENFQATGTPYASVPVITAAGIQESFDQNSKIAFVPDSDTRKNDPETILRIGRLLAIFNHAPVRLLTGPNAPDQATDQAPDQATNPAAPPYAPHIICSGAPLLDAGFKEQYHQHSQQLEDASTDIDLIITDCAAMVAQHREGTSWTRENSETSENTPKIVHLIEFLAENIANTIPTQKFDAKNFMLHDSCYIGRQLDLYEPFRTLAHALSHGNPAEFQFNRAEASCCGAAGNFHQTDPEASEKAASNILDQMDREGGNALICGTSRCKKAFQKARDQDVALDILELACRAFDL